MKTVDISASVNARRVTGGVDNGLMALHPMKHTWAREVWQVMNANNWRPAEVDLSRDIKEYPLLSEGEKRMYDKSLAFLSNLDGIQFNNLMDNIGSHISSPEIRMCISRQCFEEANHVDSYATLIEAISADPAEVYMTFERDGILAHKNKFILRQSELLGTEYSGHNFALALIANICLEGIYFYSGFLNFYTLARMGKMLGSADLIRFIQRDEETHLELFAKILESHQEEAPEIYTDEFWVKAAEIISQATQLEIEWGKHTISGGVLGLTDVIVSQHIMSLADKRLARIGRPAMYGVKNPVPWVEKFSSINGSKSNFFEAKVKSYSVGTLAW